MLFWIGFIIFSCMVGYAQSGLPKGDSRTQGWFFKD